MFHYHCECDFWNNEGIVMQDNDKNVCELRRREGHLKQVVNKPCNNARSTKTTTMSLLTFVKNVNEKEQHENNFKSCYLRPQ